MEKKEVRQLTPEEHEALCTWRKEIQNFYRREDIKWWQRAKCRWIKEGDANVAYFHRVANMMRRSNRISTITSNTCTIQGEGMIQEISAQETIL